jgi:predicted enzyme related to lactoylglutathione lyase
MITGGLATVFVSDIDRSIRFYTETLGLALEQRFGDHWASVKAANGLTIGLHPASEESPAGGKGSITIGFNLDEPIDTVVDRLKKQGVKFTKEIFQDGYSRIAYFADPDGNEFYIIELKSEWQEYAPNAAAL